MSYLIPYNKDFMIFYDLRSSKLLSGIRFYRNPGCNEKVGDVNGDGTIDILDVVRIINIILGNPPPPAACELKAADINNDGEVNILDVIAVVNMILGESYIIPWPDSIDQKSPAIKV